ncbi:MotA/TolQ/ExbB proton channel family protein [Candidatus Haliotispira prima]|uniref:MotA/TolQ/ExbB proton channel family protein n=1 Tax=Candidatus Haliotispira prima TaxID=3034016 RepID=A0ABY8MFA4_9SPIO|nr:MotA/TolQ/ExbB proton channel family protein [Candidatus Haliotispira prima]
MLGPLWILNFIASSAPSAGLLGTVIGLIRTFQEMAAMKGNLNAQNLSGGIWEAMLTTAMGLTVAIPAHFFFSYFQSIADKRLFLMSLATPPEPVAGEIEAERPHSVEVANYG